MTNRSKYNDTSALLNAVENEAIVNNLGRSCNTCITYAFQTLCTAVVQLFLAEEPNRQRWTKKCSGVVCFVKDNPKRSYFFRVYDLKNKHMVWEQEVYNNFNYKTPKEYFHTFESDDCQAGLNFASEDEAAKFKKVVDGKLLEKLQKRAEKKKQQGGMRAISPPAVNNISGNNMTGSGPPPASTSVQLNKPVTINTIKDTSKKKGNAKGGKKKLTKEDISIPTDFRHVSHVGWDPNSGLDMKKLDPEMKALFEKVGITEQSEIDEDTIDFIYDFVDKHGGMSALKADLANVVPDAQFVQPTRASMGTPNARPPPAPARIQGAPPVLPAHRGGAPPQVGRQILTPPPPPPTRAAAITSPPRVPPPKLPLGPPPPTSVNIPPPPPVPVAPPLPPSPDAQPMSGRTGLLSDIHKGASLKHVDAGQGVGTSDPRGGLLSQIRSGTQLKPVELNQNSAPAPEPKGGIVGALTAALAQRKIVIQGSDEEDGSDEIVDDDDDEWED